MTDLDIVLPVSAKRPRKKRDNQHLTLRRIAKVIRQTYPPGSPMCRMIDLKLAQAANPVPRICISAETAGECMTAAMLDSDEIAGGLLAYEQPKEADVFIHHLEIYQERHPYIMHCAIVPDYRLIPALRALKIKYCPVSYKTVRVGKYFQKLYSGAIIHKKDYLRLIDYLARKEWIEIVLPLGMAEYLESIYDNDDH